MAPETQHVEWKRSWRDEYLKWICGFANAQGGVLEIGKNDLGDVVGVNRVLGLLEDIPAKVRASLGIVVDVNLQSEGGRDYVQIQVEPSPNAISFKGRYFYRNGSTNRLLTGAALNQFLLQKQGRTWDDGPLPGVGLRDLDGRALDMFRQKAVRAERLSEDALSEPAEGLIDYFRLREGAYLKRAAVLLFHPEPERFIAGASVKIGYFRDSDVLFQDEVEGGLIAQVDQTMDLLYSKYNVGVVSYDGIYRVETYPVPRDAMREAVTNAVVHRDYANPSPIQIRVSAMQIEIWNAAQLTADWEAELRAETLGSQLHNPRVAYTFFRAGMIEAWGRGIRRTVDVCRAAGNPVPMWHLESQGAALCVKFPFSSDYRAAISAVPGKSASDPTPTGSEPGGSTTPKGSDPTPTGGEPGGSTTPKGSDPTPKGGESDDSTTPKGSDSTPKGDESGAGKDQTPARDRIVEWLRADPSLSRRDLAERVGLTPDGVKYHLSKLSEAGVIAHVGPSRGGYWVVQE